MRAIVHFSFGGFLITMLVVFLFGFVMGRASK